MLHPFVASIQNKRGTLTRFALLCALLIVPCVSHAQTAEIHIRIINGKNGRPIKNETLRVWTTREPHRRRSVAHRRQRRGPPQKSTATRKSRSMRIFMQPAAPSLKTSNPPSFSTPSPRSSAKGISTENTCGNIHVAAKPGELILFERPFTLLEKVRGQPSS